MKFIPKITESQYMETISPAGKANRERLVSDFMELTSIDALSLQEREIADVIIHKLKKMGHEVHEDGAGEEHGGNCGNLFVRIPGRGSLCELNPILFSAHMDTVGPGRGKHAIRHDDGLITGDGQAVLGADDVTGIVEILEGIRILQENEFPHRPLEILFSVSEETFGRGVKGFDCSKIKSRDVYVMDLMGPVGTAAVQAPSLIWFEIVVTGKSAHAGFDPENGIHAIHTAAKAIARIPQGRIDSQTTFNFGQIKGGSVSNIVPDVCRITGEVRSSDHQRAEHVLREAEEVFREETLKSGASFAMNEEVCIRAYCVSKDAPVCRRFTRALEMIGLGADDNTFVSTFGGSDNNVLSQKGFHGIVPSAGMYNPHSVDEYTCIKDLVQGAELIAALCMINDEDCDIIER